MNKLIYIALAGVALSQLHGCSAIDRRTTSAYVGDQEIELSTMQVLSDNLPQKNKYIAHQLQSPGAADRPGAG